MYELSLSCSHVPSDRNAWGRVASMKEDQTMVPTEKVLTSSRSIVMQETQRGAVHVTLYLLVNTFKKHMKKREIHFSHKT